VDEVLTADAASRTDRAASIAAVDSVAPLVDSMEAADSTAVAVDFTAAVVAASTVAVDTGNRERIIKFLGPVSTKMRTADSECCRPFRSRPRVPGTVLCRATAGVANKSVLHAAFLC